ncbi:hypothetical protein RIF29_21007 [Crotalaria pallida]|uniref:Uncharacterized protein n=1 Tax=Crotalaria pallida TaxID=3830 RepID=A0AAN9F4J6_CROPI
MEGYVAGRFLGGVYIAGNRHIWFLFAGCGNNLMPGSSYTLFFRRDKRLFLTALGKGDDTLFWKDLWVGDKNLKNKFPKLFQVAVDKNSVVHSNGEWDGGICRWQVSWRSLYSWEQTYLVSLCSVLEDAYPIRESSDT